MSSKQIEHCRAETLEHIHKVGEHLQTIVKELLDRAVDHDASKLKEPELSGFAQTTEKLQHTVYDSKEYHELLASLGDTIKHHYSKNRHHPEHFKNGVDDMDLIDIIEMLCDWKAATERNKNGNIFQSLTKNSERFNISDQLKNILKNTVDRYFP